MYNFYINSNGTKEGPYSAAEMRALHLSATTPVIEQSLGNRSFLARDFDFDYMAKEERVDQVDVLVTKDDFIPEVECVAEPPTGNAVSDLSEPSCLGKWCWGGFLLPGLWGLFNGVYWPLLVGIVSTALTYNHAGAVGILLRIATCIILGIKGNRWSWNYFKGDLDASSFDNRMSGWNVAAIIISVATFFLAIIF